MEAARSSALTKFFRSNDCCAREFGSTTSSLGTKTVRQPEAPFSVKDGTGFLGFPKTEPDPVLVLTIFNGR